LRELLKKSKNSKEKRPLFEEIFGRLFSKVPNKFHKLAVFGIEKGKELKLKGLNKSNIFDLEEGSEVMFYYGKGKQKIVNFTLADRGLRFLEFNTTFIEQFSDDHP
jgi:hypothetical protein